MKNNKIIGWSALAIIAVILVIVWFSRSSSTPAAPSAFNEVVSSSTPVIVSETTKVSAKTSLYQNAELGFSVSYPTAWEADNTDSGVTFIMPIDKTLVSTVAKLEGDINVVAGKCAFPPVTSVQDRGTIAVGSNSLNTISMSNSVQGRAYFNRMYSLQQGAVCYIFTFSFIALNPTAKGLTGSNATQALNNNKAIQASADAAFTDLVKTFAFIVGPAGQDETSASPKK